MAIERAVSELEERAGHEAGRGEESRDGALHRRTAWFTLQRGAVSSKGLYVAQRGGVHDDQRDRYLERNTHALAEVLGHRHIDAASEACKAEFLGRALRPINSSI